MSNLKGTIHIVHEAERYICAQQYKAIKKMTNEDLRIIAKEYKNKKNE